MKKVLLIVVSVVLSCGSPQHKKNGLKSDLVGLGNWKAIKYTERVVDTTAVGNWLPEAAISVTLKWLPVPLA
jgi:hypothetical protein